MTNSSGSADVTLYASMSPHVRATQGVNQIMWSVNIALLPAVAAAIYFFRGAAIAHLLSCVLACQITEAVALWMRGKRITLEDGSALLTGILLALNLPPNVPIWMGIVGGVFAMGVAKHCFGGLGYNIFNPALAARAFLLIAFAQDMSTGWAIPTGGVSLDAGLTGVDAYSGATALAAFRHMAYSDTVLQLDWNTTKDLLMGRTGGCLGETSTLLLLLGAGYMFWKKVITWHIPITYCVTVFVLGVIQGLVSGHGWQAGVFHLISGGLMIGAFFMATDMVTSPISYSGRIVFGLGCGILTMLIRIFGGYPEGVSFAILLMNCTTPLLDSYLRPKPFGA